MPEVSNGFSEASIASLRGGFPDDKDQFNQAYGYDSDSDLDDDDDELESGSDPEGEASSTSVATQQASATCAHEQRLYRTDLCTETRLYAMQMLSLPLAPKIPMKNSWESKLAAS